jgi:hypothetical protein
MDRYLTESSSAITTPDMLPDPEEALKMKLRIDVFCLVMDVVKVAIDRSLNDDCMRVITHITSVFLASLRRRAHISQYGNARW